MLSLGSEWLARPPSAGSLLDMRDIVVTAANIDFSMLGIEQRE
jgi:hypothetical protein